MRAASHQGFAGTDPRQDTNSPPRPTGMGHFDIMRAVADDGDLGHRHIHCAGKGLYHAAARLDSMAGIEATNEIEMIAGTMTLHRGQGTQFTIHGGDAELQATAM